MKELYIKQEDVFEVLGKAGASFIENKHRISHEQFCAVMAILEVLFDEIKEVPTVLIDSEEVLQ